MSVADVISGALLVGGLGFMLLAGIGLVRFPDLFARMHAATKAATLGSILLVGAAAFELEDVTATSLLLLVIFFLLVTSPTSAHMVARAAYRAGTELSPGTMRDDLAEVTAEADGEADAADAVDAAEAPSTRAHDEEPPADRPS